MTMIMAFHLQAHAQQAWPQQPIHIVVPFSAGGPTDSLARYLADRLRQELKAPIVVENKAGAGGLIGAQQVVRSKPDGYTFLIGSADLFARTTPLAAAEYDPLRDLAVVAKLTDSNAVLAASPQLGIKSIGELKNAAKTPDAVKCGSGGIATIGHYLCAFIARQLGVKFLHVPFKGMSDVSVALISGTIDVSVSPSFIPHAKVGKVVPLLAGTDKRLADLPNLPTFKEAGIDLRQVPTWFGMAAPAGTPAEITGRMSAALQKIIAEPRTNEVLEPFGQYGDFADTASFTRENRQARDNLILMEQIAEVR
ncbi:MAG: tripartite tricarboxylate transporter substrate binding protein [Burkholderiaceae bacterium]